MKQSTLVTKIAMYAFLLIGLIISLFPFYWMVIGATKTSGQILSIPPSLTPGTHLLENMKSLNESMQIGRVIWNSIFISFTSTFLSVLIASMAGYAFSKFNFKGKSISFFIILCTLMIPFQVTLIPLFEIMVNLNWLNTYQAIILPSLASPFAIFLMKQNLGTVPDSMIEAARIDGAGEFKIFFSIILPTMRPAIAAVSIFLFMSQWNSLLWPLITLKTTEMSTLPVALSGLVGLARIDYGQVMLGTTLSIIPILIFFLVFQKNFVSGIMGGSIKE